MCIERWEFTFGSSGGGGRGFVSDLTQAEAQWLGSAFLASGVALIFVARDGENSIAVAGGANAKLSRADVKKAAGFDGAPAVALAESKSLRDAVRFANAAAALSVTRLGAQQSAPNRAEVERFLGRRK